MRSKEPNWTEENQNKNLLRIDILLKTKKKRLNSRYAQKGSIF